MVRAYRRLCVSTLQCLHLPAPLPLAPDPAPTSIMFPRLHPEDEFAGMISWAFYFQSWNRCASGSLPHKRRKMDPECGQQLAAQIEPTAPKRCSSQGWQQENLAQLAAMLTVQKTSALQLLAAWVIRGQAGGISSLGPSFTEILSTEWLTKVSAPVPPKPSRPCPGLPTEGGLAGDLQTLGAEQQEGRGPAATRRGHSLKASGQGLVDRAFLKVFVLRSGCGSELDQVAGVTFKRPPVSRRVVGSTLSRHSVRLTSKCGVTDGCKNWRGRCILVLGSFNPPRSAPMLKMRKKA